MRNLTLAAAIAAVMLAGSGCGSTTTPSLESTAPDHTGSESPTSTMASASAPDTPPEVGTLIDVTIAGGTVAPTNAEVDAVAGRPIVLAVNSDAPDSIHVHSVPEHVFEVQARPDQRFEFTVDVPGQVDVELHDVNRTIVTITVHPR